MSFISWSLSVEQGIRAREKLLARAERFYLSLGLPCGAATDAAVAGFVAAERRGKRAMAGDAAGGARR